MRMKTRTATAVVVSFALLVGAGFVWSQIGESGTTPVVVAEEKAIPKPPVPPAGIKHADSLSSAFRVVAKHLRPSVVSVRSTRTIQGARRSAMPEIPNEFRRFFEDDTFGRFFERRPNQSFRQRSEGSGVIVSSDGSIITNNHVVRNADSVEVVLHDKRSFKAKIVGTDPKTDIAVLKIDTANLKPATLGDSEAAQVGDWVLAIGNPFGLTQTVTAGIISAKGRDRVGITDYEDFLQTDASINPGNSGGPLVNLRGEVIGVNTAIASKTKSNAGVGFAIPSKMVKHVYAAIVKSGRVERGRIGAVIQDLTPPLAKSFGYTGRDRGVLVGDIIARGPAAKAGLKSGDIIVRFEGKQLRSVAHLRNSIASTQPGTKVALRVFRGGKVLNLEVRIGTLDEQTATKPGDSAARLDQQQFDDLGLTLSDISDELAAKLRIRKNAGGAVVTKVKAGSLASQVGLRPGDLIVAVAGKKIAGVKDYVQTMNSQDPTRGIRMTVRSGGVRRFIFVQSQ